MKPMLLVDFLEWVCGTVSLTVIGTALALKELNSYGQWVVIILLYIFLLSSAINRGKNGWFRSKQKLTQ